MENIKIKIEQLEKELAKLKQKVVSRNNQHTTINSVEDAFDLLKPEWYIDDNGTIGQYEFDEDTKFEWGECNMTSEKRAKQIKALIQLHLVAEAMNMGVERKENQRVVYFISRILKIEWFFSCHTFSDIIPMFNTQQLAEEALEKFRDLFKDLYMLND